MEYKFTLKLTNLILLLLTVCICTVFVACSRQNSATDDNGSAADKDSSGNVSDALKPDSVPTSPLTVEQAIKLVEQDKAVTEIFVCNSLCDKTAKQAIYQALAAESEYANFSAVEALLKSVYSASAEEHSFFLSYRSAELPSVKNENGNTNVFYHPGSDYTDFIDNTTVAAEATGKETEYVIKAKTLSGKDISLTAAWEQGSWRLQKGVFLTNTQAEDKFTGGFPTKNAGSLSNLSGNILVIELFISDEEWKITTQQEQEFHKTVLAATDKISQQTAAYGCSTTFEFQPERFIHESVLGNRVLDFDLMIAETGFGSLEAFAEYVAPNLSDYDNYFFAVCVAKDVETTVGVHDNTEDTEFYKGERVILGNGGTSLQLYNSILKLAGAYGYNENTLDDYTESLYKVYFPNCGVTSTNTETAEISPVAAYSCGITDELDKLYRIFIPKK